jgi:hypothetical protein
LIAQIKSLQGVQQNTPISYLYAGHFDFLFLAKIPLLAFGWKLPDEKFPLKRSAPPESQ